MNIPLKKLHPAAQLPRRNTNTDAGYDLCAVESYSLAARTRIVVRTGVSLAIPPGYYGRIAPRSGLAVKHGIDVLAGVVDSGYRNEIGVVLINLGSQAFTINEGDRIAQLIIEKYHDAEWKVVEALPESVRGDAGFGSSGMS